MVHIHEKSDETVTFTDTSKLCADISSLYLSEKFSDVTLVVDGQKIFAHKVILAVRSEFFETLLHPESQTSKQNEVTISDVAPEAFKSLLKYIYTGTITISSDVELTLKVLGLAHQYSLKHLENGIVKEIKSILNLKNVCSVLNTANLYDLNELKNACLSFMDNNAPEILSSDCFEDLTQQSMIKLLQRDTFFAPEIEIFKSVAKWCKTNNDVDELVIKCVRLSWLSVVEIVSIVWPSKLVDCESLLHAIAEIVDVKPKISQSRGFLLMDENLATPQHKAEVISNPNWSFLLTGNRNVDKFAGYTMDGKSSFVIKLNVPSYLNHISMLLWDKDARYYSYYIEVSLDQKKWRKIIDYSRFACRSQQTLFFDQQIAQYVKIVGTHNTANNDFHLIYFEAYFKSIIPKFISGIVCPDKNVATLEKKALVIQGENANFLLNGDTKNYDGGTGYTYHLIGSGGIILQLAQPYMISSIRLLLWDKDNRAYRYFIETSSNKSDWELAVDKRNEDCRSWQNLHFKERVVVFVRLTGTSNTANNVSKKDMMTNVTHGVETLLYLLYVVRVFTVFISSVHLKKKVVSDTELGFVQVK